MAIATKRNTAVFALNCSCSSNDSHAESGCLGCVRKRSAQKPPDAGQLDHRQKRCRQFIKPCRQAPVLLEPSNQPLYRVPARVERLVEHRRTSSAATRLARSQLPLGDHRPNPAQPHPNPLRVVAPVGEQPLRTTRSLDKPTDGLELRRLSALPRREVNGQREPVAIADDVELGRPPASASSERLGLRYGISAPLFRAPEATREARIKVPSIIHVE